MRLIDADELKKELNSLAEDLPQHDHGMSDACHYMADGVDKAIYMVEDMPTIDAVPVVRCRSCKHWTPGDYFLADTGVCARTLKQTWDCDYCSKAERKEEQ